MTWGEWWIELLTNFGVTPENALVLFIGAGIAFLLAVGILVFVATVASPQWFSRSFASAAGGFAGATAAMVVVVVVGCMCAVVGCAAVLLVVPTG